MSLFSVNLHSCPKLEAVNLLTRSTDHVVEKCCFLVRISISATSWGVI